MKNIQVVLDEPLLRATDREARRARVNRSALIREAIREHLRRRRLAEEEEKERRAFREQPIAEEELAPWTKVQVWPRE